MRVVACLLALCAAAHAQGTKKDKPGPLPGAGVDWKGDWNEAVKESNPRNVPVFFILLGGSDANSLSTAEAFTDPKVIEASRNFVNIVGMQDTGHGEKEVQIGKEKVKLCKLLHTVPCAVHVKGYDTMQKYFQGNVTIPAYAFGDPVGKELFKEQGKAQSSSDITKNMDKALRQVSGDKVHWSAWNQAKTDIAKGDVLLEKKEYKKAIELFLKVRKMKPGFGFKDMGEAGLERADKVGGELLKQALDLSEVDARKKALKKVMDDFKGVEASDKAEKELDKLK